MYKGQSITVIIPCLNEEQGIERVLRAMPDFVDETIVVDNNSTDRTSDVAASLGAKVIREEVRGYGRSYKRGFAAATSDLIVTLDGDHSYPVDALSYLLEAFLHLGVDFLNASRFPVRDRAAMSFKHHVGNLVLSLATSLLYFRWVRDSQSGMWVFRRSILKFMHLESDGMAFSEEIKIEALRHPEIRFGEISIMYTSRLGEKKLNPWRDGFQNLWFLVKRRFREQAPVSGAAITVIVPVWNGRALLEKLLCDLDAQTRPAVEILVVDNGSADGAPEAAERAGARVIRMGSNRGFAAAVNRGIAECRTELVAVVNQDIEAAPDWLARLAGALDDEQAWFAAGKILQASHRDLLDGTFDALCRGACAWRIGNGRPDGAAFSVRRRIVFPPGTAALFRAALFRRLGPLDERFESYLEDVDLGLRCALDGLSGWYVPEAVVWHHGSASLGRWHPETVRRIARNQVFLVKKHYPARLILRCAWPILVAQALWGVLALRHGTFFAWLRGKLAGLARPCGSVHSNAALLPILQLGEREIFAGQSKTGFDFYWRWYFLLTRGGAS